MKNIEDTVKPIMTDLIVGNERRLTPDEQALVATWAILKVMVAEYDLKGDVSVHYKQRQYIMQHRMAPLKGWGVWIGSFERIEWVPEWVSHPMLLVHPRVANRRVNHNATSFNSNATTQVLGKLFIHVIHSPMPTLIKRWRFAPPHKGALFRIWPPTKTSIKWPGPALDDIAADNIADALSRYILNLQAKWLAEKQ